MLFDVDQSNWRTYSGQWQLGENWNCEWILAYSCHTVALSNVAALWNIFAGMHIYCGAWDNMYDGITTDECGEDVADNLTDGDTVCDAWIDGVSDWAVDNHPIAVCVGDAETWNSGNIRWDRSHLNRDHLWGHHEAPMQLPYDSYQNRSEERNPMLTEAITVDDTLGGHNIGKLAQSPERHVDKDRVTPYPLAGRK